MALPLRALTESLKKFCPFSKRGESAKPKLWRLNSIVNYAVFPLGNFWD